LIQLKAIIFIKVFLVILINLLSVTESVNLVVIKNDSVFMTYFFNSLNYYIMYGGWVRLLVNMQFGRERKTAQNLVAWNLALETLIQAENCLQLYTWKDNFSCRDKVESNN
jgi:hypothetical protein